MEEEISNCIQHQNPLEIELIIDTIVSYLHRIKDLTSCRQISRKWNSLVSPKLQEKLTSKSLVFEAQPQIRTYEDDDEGGVWADYHPFTGDPTGSKLEDFLDFLKENSPEFIAFSNFTFIDICLRHRMTQQFLNSHGHMIKALTLDYRKIKLCPIEPTIQKRTEAFMELIQRQCPNLKKLKIYGKSSGPPPLLLDQWQPKDIATKCKIKELTLHYQLPQETQHQNFLQGLISCCTSSLEKITIGARFASPFVADEEFFDICLTPFVNACATTLKELNIVEHANLGGNTTSTLLRLFRHPQLQLKCLRINGHVFRGVSDDDRVEVYKNPLSTTLELQKSSLEELHLIPTRSGGRIAFPDCMPKLKMLRISSDSIPTFAPTNFLRQLPSLKKLVLTTDSYVESGWKGLKFLTENSDPQLALTELRLPFANSEVLEHAPKIFPNVKELVIETDLDGLCGIFSWSELESLHLTLRARDKNDGHQLTLEQILDGHSPSGKSLAHLKKLKQLTIDWNHPPIYTDSYGYDSDTEDDNSEPTEMRIVTDSSLLNVFSKLPELAYISIQEHHISDKDASKFLFAGRMRLLSDGVIGSIGSRFKCQKDYFKEDYIPHKLLHQKNN